MSIMIAKQAACVDILRAWIGRDAAINTVERLEAPFAETPTRVGDLVRLLVSTHGVVGKGALFSKLSRVVHPIELNAWYFEGSSLEQTVRKQCDAHLAFDTLVSAVARDPDLGPSVAPALAESFERLLQTVTMPDFVRRELADASSGGRGAPFYLPVAALARLVGDYYALLCKQVGPAVTDRSFARALDAARRAAPLFDPRTLL